MNILIPSHYVVLTFDSFGNFKDLNIAAKEKTAHRLNLTSAEQHEVWQAYAETIALEQANFRATARQAHGINLPQNIRIPYRLVLSDSSSIVHKIKSQQVFSDALTDYEPLRLIKSTAENAIMKRLNLLDDLPLSLQKHVGEFLLFEDGQGLLGVSHQIRAAVINRCYPLLRPAELTLVMDITGSMGTRLNEAKNMLRTILHSLNTTMLQKGSYQRSAWLGYRDLKDNERFHLKDFSTNPDVISQYIQNTMAYGGDDVPEDVAGAMHLLLNDLSWTANPHARGLKNVVWVLDAPPHGMGSDGDHYPNGTPGRDWLALAHLMKKRGVVVHPVVCAEQTELNLFASTVAHITGGTCVRLSSHAMTGALSQQISACINRDVDLQQAVEIEINKRLLRAVNQAESVEITPELIAGFAAQAVQTLLTSDAYQITELTEVQLPLTNTAEQLSLCDSQPTARAQGLLPAERVTIPVILPLVDDLFAASEVSDAVLPFCHLDDDVDDELFCAAPVRMGAAHKRCFMLP